MDKVPRGTPNVGEFFGVANWFVHQFSALPSDRRELTPGPDSRHSSRTNAVRHVAALPGRMLLPPRPCSAAAACLQPASSSHRSAYVVAGIPARAGPKLHERCPPGHRVMDHPAGGSPQTSKGASLTIGSTLDFLKMRRLRAFRRRRTAMRTKPEQEPALRSELFSAEQMERHGQALAAQHRLSPRSRNNLLLDRLDDNEAVLIHTCERLTEATRRKRRITPAGEWLLDNFYLVEEQIRIARRHLPKGYSRELPRLESGPSAGLPRAYDIALEIISHGDGRVDTLSLHRFVHAYQSVTGLSLGELWAIPIMLRLALIENLRRVAARVMADWRYRGKAVRWADVMAATAESDPKSVVLVVADMARSDPPMTGPFVAEMARRLQGQSPALALPPS